MVRNGTTGTLRSVLHSEQVTTVLPQGSTGFQSREDVTRELILGYLNEGKREFLIDLKINKNYIWLYYIIFFALWCIKELWLVQYVELMDSIPRTIISAIIKITIWVIPVILLIKVIEKSEPFTYLGLRYNFRKGFKWASWITLVLIPYFFILNFAILDNSIDFQMGFNELLNTVLLVGFIEEIVFRGFLLRKLMDSFRFWIANAITSVLFVSIHFPIWLYKGLFEIPSILSASITVFLLGIIFGFVYKKSKSLWSVIIIHSLYNLLVSLFY